MKIITPFLLLIVISGCTTKKEKDPLQRFEKLSGLWQTHNSETDLYEEWSEPKDSVMYGKSYVLNESDTLVKAKYQLKKIGTNIFYIPTITGENNNQPVQFKLINNTDSLLVFDNPDHDFPQRIMYRFYGNDSIVARVQGIVQGELHFEEFYLRRIPHSTPKH